VTGVDNLLADRAQFGFGVARPSMADADRAAGVAADGGFQALSLDDDFLRLWPAVLARISAVVDLDLLPRRSGNICLRFDLCAGG